MKVSLLATLLFLVGSLPSYALDQQAAGEKFVEHRVNKMMEKLDLTADQAKQVKAVREKMRPKLKAARQEKREAFKNFTALLQGDSKDDAMIREAYKNLQTVKASAQDAHFEMILAIRNILTPEQRQKFAALKKERGEGLRGRFQRRFHSEDSLDESH